MFSRSAAVFLVSAGLGIGTLTPTVAFSFVPVGGAAVRAGTIPRGPSMGGSGYQGRHVIVSIGTSRALPQMRCIPRQMRRLFALDPSADPDFVAATAAHLCGVRDAG
jgi:hypothetical protein